MTYPADTIVITKDGKQHRILWPTRFDADHKPTRYRVKPSGSKARGSYEIKANDIADTRAR